MELLFTEDRYDPVERPTPEWLEVRDRWANLALPRLIPHRCLYEFFLNRGDYPTPYFEWYANIYRTRGLQPPLDEPRLLDERYGWFRQLKRALDGGTSFFRDCPVSVELHPSGYFNIRDGHHRAMFLYCSGIRRIPCRMTRDDFARWASPEHEQAVVSFAQQLSTPIYTPLLIHTPFEQIPERDWYYPSRLDRILSYLGPRRLRGRTVLDIGSNIGFYTHHFAREGASVTAVEPNPKHAQLCRKLGDAFRLKYTLHETTFEDAPLEPHEVGLMLTVYYHFAEDPIRGPKFLEKLGQTVTEMLFWESGPSPEGERAQIHQHTLFKHYRSLGFTYGTGKSRELGVFFRSSG